MNEERWRPIPGHRGYEASNLGRVRSVDRTLRSGRRAGGVVLVPWLDKDGYQVVKLGRRNVRVNVAVALAWRGKPEVRHLDGDRLNNTAVNIQWGTHWMNEQDKKQQRDRENREEEWVPPQKHGTPGTREVPG